MSTLLRISVVGRNREAVGFSSRGHHPRNIADRSRHAERSNNQLNGDRILHMLITTGKVHNGSIQVDDESLPEGAIVTVLTHEGDETFELGPEEEAQLLAALAEAERGEVINASQVLQQIRAS